MKSSEGKILSQQIFTEGLTAPYQPNYPFYHNNLLYLLIGVSTQNSIEGKEASLVQYTSAGNIARNLTFPLPCTGYCSLEGSLFGLINDTAYFNIMRIEQSLGQVSCMVYEVNLTSFSLVKTSSALNETGNCEYSLPVWAPYNSTHAIFREKWFSYQTLSFVGEEPLPIYIHNFGGSTPALSDQNLIFYEELDGYNTYFVQQNVETFKDETPNINEELFFVFLGDNTTNVVITYDAYPLGVNFTIIDASLSSFPLHFSSFSYDVNGYQTNMFADNANNIFFIGMDYSTSPAGNLLIAQLQIDANNIPSLYDQIIIDGYQVNSYYPAFYSVLSWGLSSSSQQFALIAGNNSDFTLFVIDYDNSPSAKYS